VTIFAVLILLAGMSLLASYSGTASDAGESGDGDPRALGNVNQQVGCGVP
jgi:hypothetical protein